MMVADYYDSSMQALEPFIWTFGDATSILLCSLLLILLFLDLPKLSPFTPYMLVAAGTVFLYFFGDNSLYGVCDSGNQSALYEKNIPWKHLEQNSGSFSLF